MLDPQFWPTVAVVLPVFGLAIVVEARATILRWNNDFSRRIRAMQSILWLLPLAMSAYLEPTAFLALEGNKTPHIAVILVNPTIASSISVLILAPSLELLVRANARLVIRVTTFFGTAKLRWQSWRIMVGLRRMQRAAKVRRSEIVGALVNVRQIETTAKAQTHLSTSETQLVLTQCTQARAKLNGYYDDSCATLARLSDLMQRSISSRTEFNEAREKYISLMEVQLTALGTVDPATDEP